MLNEKAAAVLHDARERRGWSRAQLREATKALGMEVSEATIYDLEKGHDSPRKRTIYKLAEALELNPDDLFADPPATDEVAS